MNYSSIDIVLVFVRKLRYKNGPSFVVTDLNIVVSDFSKWRHGWLLDSVKSLVV